MWNKAYKYTFKLHISHNPVSVSKQSAHFHTIKIILYLQNFNNKFSKFDVIEKIIQNYFEIYEGAYLNETASFQELDPTIENIGRVFYSHLKSIVRENGFELLTLEISETPTRIFSISEKEFF
ncbi:MAG: 6-carboxy-5,6,7,8-tetrahydropterin synthase [Eubacteriales bacterium]|jgi:6-pyruvoyltetrahydropterin/6-carboxytetrahydropterin synthase